MELDLQRHLAVELGLESALDEALSMQLEDAVATPPPSPLRCEENLYLNPPGTPPPRRSPWDRPVAEPPPAPRRPTLIVVRLGDSSFRRLHF